MRHSRYSLPVLYTSSEPVCFSRTLFYPLFCSLAFAIGACGGSEGSDGDASPGGATSDGETSPGGEASPDGDGQQKREHTFTDAEDWQKELIDLINEHRAKGATCGDKELGPVQPLVLDEEMTPRLNKAAEHHVKDMDEKGITGHLDENGSGVLHRIWVENRDWTGDDHERGWSYAGEAVASGTQSPEEMVAEWMSDERYCDVLMNENGVYAGMARQRDNLVLVTADILTTDYTTGIAPDEQWKQELLVLWNEARKNGDADDCPETKSLEEPVVYSDHFEAVALYKALDVEYTGKKGWKTSDNLSVGGLASHMLPDHWPGLDLLVYVGKDATPQKAFDNWYSQRCWLTSSPYVGFARKGNAWVVARGTPSNR